MKKRDEMMLVFDNVNINLRTLKSIKQQRQSLPEDKEKYMQELTEEYKKTGGELKSINETIEEATQFLQNISVIGRISASAKVYPGVIINIRDIKYSVTSEHKACTFVFENGLIRAVSYIEPNADSSQKAAK
jgi:uncharacterized protein (DUF342 family)